MPLALAATQLTLRCCGMHTSVAFATVAHSYPHIRSNVARIISAVIGYKWLNLERPGNSVCEIYRTSHLSDFTSLLLAVFSFIIINKSICICYHEQYDGGI